MFDTYKTESKAIDVSKQLYDNTTPATLYMIYDLHTDAFIITLPISVFTWTIYNDRDYDELMNLHIDELNDDKKAKLVELIKHHIERW